MNWRAYALRFVTAEGLRWYYRSERAPTERWLTFVALTPLMAALFLAIEIVWLLTGRGRRIRHALGHDEVQVIPGARGIPPEFRRRMDALGAQKREEFERMKAELEAKRAQAQP